MLKNKDRFLFMILAGIVIAFILKVVIYADVNEHSQIYDYLITILITIIVWEGNLRIDQWMNTHFPWTSKTKQRILLHLPVALLYSTLTLYFLILGYSTVICGMTAEHKKLMQGCLLISMLITVSILSLEIGGQLLKGWKVSLVEVEKYKTESVQAQLQNLKDQINPHFLFNNLSVLSSLVQKDQEKAVDFIQQLSKVYRYVLDNKSKELARLEEEMRFMDSYMYLLKIRFDPNIRFVMEIEKDQWQRFLPPMALQMLIENAVKHNEISSEFPLTITVLAGNEQLEVRNNFQPRLHKEAGANSGLKNISDRYRYFTDKEIEIIQNEKEFIVRIPLLHNV